MAQVQVVELGGVGPGYTVSIHTDFVGDVPLGSRWDIIVETPDHETSCLGQSEVWAGADQSCILGVRQGANGVFPGDGTVAVGTPCVVTVKLTTPQSQQLDSGSSIAVPWNDHSYEWFQTLLNSVNAAARGGLTQQEHTWLDDTQQAVVRVFTDLAGQALSSPVGGLLSHPDLRFIDACGSVFPLFSRGELDPAALVVGFQPYGLSLAVHQVPNGFGLRDGSLTEYTDRIVQLVVLHHVRGGPAEWVTETLDMHVAQRLFLWEQAFPSRILYDVTPGCIVNAQWACANPF